MIKIKEMDYDFVVASFLKYSFQEGKIFYLKDIENFVDYLKEKEVILKNEEKLNNFFDKFEDLFSVDYDKDEQVVLNDPNKLENLLKIKDILVKNEHLDALTEVEKEIRKIKQEINCVQLEKLKEKFIKSEKEDDIDYISTYIYLYKNYKNINYNSIAVIRNEDKLYLRKQLVIGHGVTVSGRYTYEVIPDLRDNNMITETKKEELKKPNKAKIL